MAETLASKTPVEEKAHRWRRCPIGKHLVREHLEHIPPSKVHPNGTTTIRHEHCANNPSHKDELSYDEIQYITETHFAGLTGSAPIAGVLKFDDESKYDQQIRGWTEYWNDIFKLSDPLDPNLVKALIATEASFKENPPHGPKTAHGLMQITDETFPIFSDIHGELKDYLIRVSAKELLEPSTNICMGIRWLFRKKEIVSSKLGREATWLETVAAYKSVLKKKAGKEKDNKEKRNSELMRRFYEYYKPLQEAKNKL